MAFQISGDLIVDTTARIIVINQSDWSVDTTEEKQSGPYTITVSDGSKKLVIARESNGSCISYGNMTPEEI